MTKDWVSPEENKAKKDAYYSKLSNDTNRSLTYYWQQARKGARDRKIDFSITADDIISLWSKQRGFCKLSNIPMTLTHGTLRSQNPTKVSFDRIDNSKGYHVGNIQLVTWQVNCAKSVWSTDQLVELCISITEKALMNKLK